jgi:hypothetical protein
MRPCIRGTYCISAKKRERELERERVKENGEVGKSFKKWVEHY